MVGKKRAGQTRNKKKRRNGKNGEFCFRLNQNSRAHEDIVSDWWGSQTEVCTTSLETLFCSIMGIDSPSITDTGLVLIDSGSLMVPLVAVPDDRLELMLLLPPPDERDVGLTSATVTPGR